MTFFNLFGAARPTLILPLVCLNCSSQFSISSIVTQRDLALSTSVTSKLFSFSTSGRSRCLVLSGCPMIINSVFLGLGLSLLTFMHSERLESSRCASSTSFATSSDAIVVLVSSAWMLALEKLRHFSKSFK